MTTSTEDEILLLAKLLWATEWKVELEDIETEWEHVSEYGKVIYLRLASKLNKLMKEVRYNNYAYCE